jgi:hypothetical protein
LLGWQVLKGAAAAAAAAVAARFIFRRVVLLSNRSKKETKQSEKNTLSDKEKGEKMLLGLLSCQTGGGAHCVTWRGGNLFAGDVFARKNMIMLVLKHEAQCSANVDS